jgi:hypothetical protein
MNSYDDQWNNPNCWDHWYGFGAKLGFRCGQVSAWRPECWSGGDVGLGTYTCTCLESWCWQPSGNPDYPFDKYACQPSNCMPWTDEALEEYEVRDQGDG